MSGSQGDKIFWSPPLSKALESSRKVQKISFQVGVQENTLPVDKGILAHGTELSRKKIRKILDMGGISVNGQRARTASWKLKFGDQVSVQYSLSSLEIASQKKFELSKQDILFQNKKIIAINKPPLLPSQETKSSRQEHALQVVSKYLQANQTENSDLYLCHRLDKETSGILLLSTCPLKLDWIMSQFKNRSVEKTYIALCFGKPKQNEWHVSSHLSEINKKTGLVKVVNSGGKKSSTFFKLVKYFPKYNLSLINCYPKTGRTHQIRVHLEESKVPIVGDKKYGEKFRHSLPKNFFALCIAHHFLHAERILFFPSSNESAVSLKASLPKNFKAILSLLKFKL